VRRKTTLIALGVGAVAIFVLATLPAGIVTGPLERLGVGTTAVGGTVWSGQAQGLSVDGTVIGDLRWSLRPLDLLRGRLAGHAQLARLDGAAETDFERSWSGRLRLESTRADLPLEALAPFRLGIPSNWRGRVSAEFAELLIEGGWPVSARGTLDLRQLVAPPPRAAALGSFRLDFPGEAAAAETLRAGITQTEGPLTVDGELSLGKDRSFLIEGSVAPRGPPAPDLANALAMLGPPDANNRRPFSIAGTL
jgi:hypothetical protein